MSVEPTIDELRHLSSDLRVGGEKEERGGGEAQMSRAQPSGGGSDVGGSSAGVLFKLCYQIL